MNEQREDATGDATDARPSDVIVFLALLTGGIAVGVALLYGFFWLMFDASN